MHALIDETVHANPVVVFMKGTADQPLCGFSRTVIHILRQYPRLPRFATVNVLADEGLRAAIKTYSSWPTIPQVFVRGKFVGGCDIVRDMHQTGQLEKLLEDENVFDAGADVDGDVEKDTTAK